MMKGFLYHVHYIAPLVMIRLGLVLLPLPYHNYTGTAIPFRWCLEVFYGSTLIIAMCQLLGILIWNPESLSSLVTTSTIATTTNNNNNNNNSTSPFPITYWILGLDLVSNSLHFLLLWHVRSTAPMIASWTNHTPTTTTTTTTPSHSLLYVYAQQHSKQQQQQTTLSSTSRNDGETSNHSPRLLFERIRYVPDGYDGRYY
jgi:hypothetical protein